MLRGTMKKKSNQALEMRPASRRRGGAVTQRDLARAAGVSLTTVYNALHRPHMVRQRTIAKIHRLIETNDYVPNEVARNMVRRKTDVLGIIVPVLEVLYYAKLVSAIERAANAAGYNCIICQHCDDPLKEEREVQMMRQRRVDGILLHNCGQATDTGALQRLAANGVPFVLVGGRADGLDEHFVGGDDRAMAARAVEWLIEQGHRRIAHLAWYRTGEYHMGPRYLGYADALERHGLPVDPDLVEMCQSEYRGGRLELLNILRRTEADRPTAVFTSNDQSALGALAGLWEAGLRVPEDVSVVSYGGYLDEALMPLTLAAVVEPVEEIAWRACEMLLGRIEKRPVGGGPILVPGKFRPGQSAAPAGGLQAAGGARATISAGRES